MSSRGPDVIKWGLDLPVIPPPPSVHRDERGELDVEAITLAWLGWQRLRWGGADQGGRHYEAVRRSEGAIFTAGAGRHRVELEDRAGRHWPVWERQQHTLAKAVAVFEAAGVMF